MDSQQNKKDEIVNFIIQNPESPIAKVLQDEVPQNDLEYVSIWRPYYVFLKTDEDLFKHLLYSWGNDLLDNDLQLRYEIWKEVKDQYLENVGYSGQTDPPFRSKVTPLRAWL